VVLALALLSLLGAVVILGAGVAAALADGGESDLEPTETAAAADERPQVVPLRGSEAPPPGDALTGRLPSQADREDGRRLPAPPAGGGQHAYTGRLRRA
jgi:hypothetical protein